MRERVEPTPRKSVSAKRRIALFERAGGRCECGCGEKLKPDWQLEHRIPLWCGGADSEENYEAWNKQCHARKTSGEATVRGKVNRLIARENGTRRERKPIPSRPFGKQTKQKWPSRGWGKKNAETREP